MSTFMGTGMFPLAVPSDTFSVVIKIRCTSVTPVRFTITTFEAMVMLLTDPVPTSVASDGTGAGCPFTDVIGLAKVTRI